MKSIGFRILIVFFLLLSPTVYGQLNVKDSLQSILRDEQVESETRFRNAYNLIFYNSSPKEAETLGLNTVYPFVKKTWKSKSEQLVHLSKLHLLVSFCYRERGGENRNEMERQFVEKALETAKESGDNTTIARCYHAFAFMEIKRGDTQNAHKCLYQAIIYYDKAEQYVKSSEMLYVIASSFVDIKDTKGIKRLLSQMEGYLKKDSSKQSQYAYNVVRHAYFETLLEKEKADKGTVDYKMVDSMMLFVNKNVDLVENSLNELSPNWMHSYAYFFLAKELNVYYPKESEKIIRELDRAVKMINKEPISRNNEANAVMELNIRINEVRAKVMLRSGKNKESYRAISEAMSLLEKLKGYQNIHELRCSVYTLMVEYSEKTGQVHEALKYQKLLQEIEAKRYENEKVQAINDMSAKYETEKKEVQIQTLTKEKEIAQLILWLSIGLFLALFATFVSLILSNRLKRKNVEQKLYETALLAELRQEEIEKMQNLKQHFEQNPVRITIEKIAHLISTNSLIERESKDVYLEQISKIDPKLFEQMYQTSKVKITNMDMKYIICFYAEIEVKDISLLFNVDSASVHTVRYRIKRKFSEEDAFRLIL